jgi:tetratricopeptide (TPR) repeat protein
MNDNDQFLEQIVRGNTLEALNRLYHAPQAAEDGRLLINRALYGARDEDNLERVKGEEERHLAALGEATEKEKAALLYNLGCFSLHLDEILEARIQFDEAVKLQPDNLMARHNLAYAYELMAEFDEAKAEYARVLEQNPGCVLTRLNLAQLRIQEGTYEEGLEELHQLHVQQPDNVGLLLYLCRGLLLRGTTRDLEEVLELLEQHPESSHFLDLRECRAFALYLLGEVDEAERGFNELLEENPDNLFARLGVIKILANRGNLAELTPHLEHYQALNPSEDIASLLRDLGGR